jgi:two-component sensor histidine kinase
MAASSWTPQEPRTRTTDATPVGRWRPTRLAELTTSRLQLSAALHDGARPAGADEDAVQRLLLVFEELTSNAMRHGSPPIEVAVTQTGRSWLLEVSDTAADRPPEAAADRDPALGGLGLPLVALLCADHGWTVDGDRKVVWASIDHASG